MQSLAIVIGQSINIIILITALITVGGFIWVVTGTGKINAKIEEDRKKSRGRVDYTPNGFKRNPDTYSMEDTLAYLEEFNNVKVNYDIFEQLVPIFPLLGILGTVAGLIQQLSDVSQMQAALGMSMSTTFYGLLAAIALRVIDAVWVSKSVNKMDQYFETFEQNYNIAKDKHIQDGEGSQS